MNRRSRVRGHCKGKASGFFLAITLVWLVVPSSAAALATKASIDTIHSTLVVTGTNDENDITVERALDAGGNPTGPYIITEDGTDDNGDVILLTGMSPCEEVLDLNGDVDHVQCPIAGIASISIDSRDAPTDGVDRVQVTDSKPADITGGNGDDDLYGGDGGGTLDGGGGDDDLNGGDGNDTLRGGANDAIKGDALFGGSGNDTLDGGPGDGDLLVADTGADTLIGGTGTGDTASYDPDTVGGGPHTNNVIVTLDGLANDGNADDFDLVTGKHDNVSATDIEILIGSTGDDRLTGTAGNDIIHGADPHPTSYSEIYAMNADGSGQTNLTNNAAADSNPAWSSDGSKIAFGRRNGSFDIYTMNPDGSGQTNLTSGSASDDSPAWSPDGSKIAFARDGEIYVMNANGTGQTNVTNSSATDFDNEPSWSPDGSKIAFSTFRGSGYEIYAMNPDGSGQTNLINDPVNPFGSAPRDREPAWSPDGSKIAFARDGALYTMNPDGTGRTSLPGGRAPAWSVDGSKIASEGLGPGLNNTDIFVVNANGTGLTNVTNNPTADHAPAWSPDGRIAFSTTRPVDLHDGSDVLDGGAGADTLGGGDGQDRVDYSKRSAKVTVDLTSSAGQGEVGEGDTLQSLEDVTGGSGDDSLTGNSGANALEGGPGADTIDGAGGTDAASYAGASAGVTVNLSTVGAQSTDGAGTDTLSGLENLTGSAFGDTLTGSAVFNVINSGDGNDNVNVRDSGADEVACDGGTLDSVTADGPAPPDTPLDSIAPDCEQTSYSGPPPAPTLTDTDPDSPANENSPKVIGSAQAGTRVDLYSSPDCSGSPLATGTADSSGSFEITVSVEDDSTTSFYATATDEAQNLTSDCSSGEQGSITYVEKSTPLLTGKGKLTLKDNASDHAKRSLNMSVKGQLPSAGGVLGAGASLRVTSGSFEDTYVLPASGWSVAGTKYRYKDKYRENSPITAATIGPAYGIKVKGNGTGPFGPLGHVLTLDPGSATIVFAIADTRYCSSFGTDARYKDGSKFSAKTSPITNCPV